VERPRKQEVLILANDDRPVCPFCGGHEVNRRGLIRLKTGGTTQRWRCRPCGRRFVSRGHRVAVLDRRKVSHFDLITPRCEALFLFHYAKRNGDFDAVRQLIAVGEREKTGLEFLIAGGALNRADVDAAVNFRGKVLELFDSLVERG